MTTNEKGRESIFIRIDAEGDWKKVNNALDSSIIDDGKYKEVLEAFTYRKLLDILINLSYTKSDSGVWEERKIIPLTGIKDKLLEEFGEELGIKSKTLGQRRSGIEYIIKPRLRIDRLNDIFRVHNDQKNFLRKIVINRRNSYIFTKFVIVGPQELGYPTIPLYPQGFESVLQEKYHIDIARRIEDIKKPKEFTIEEAFKTILWQEEYSPLLTDKEKQFLIDNLNLGEEETFFNWPAAKANKLAEIIDYLTTIWKKVKDLPNLNTLFLFYHRTGRLPFTLFEVEDNIEQYRPKLDVVSNGLYKKLRFIYLEALFIYSLQHPEKIHAIPILLDEMEEISTPGREKAWVVTLRLFYMSEICSLNSENVVSLMDSIEQHYPGYKGDIRFLFYLGKTFLNAGLLDRFDKIMPLFKSKDGELARTLMVDIPSNMPYYQRKEIIINEFQELASSDRLLIKLMAMGALAKHVSIQNLGEALKIVEKAIKIFNLPFLQLVYLDISLRLLITEGSYDTALELIKSGGFRLPPSVRAQFYLNLTVIYGETNQREKALECADKALAFFQLSPIYSTTVGDLKDMKGRILIDGYRDKKDLNLLESAENLVKESISLLTNPTALRYANIHLAWVYLLKGEYSDFEKIFEGLLKGASGKEKIGIQIEKVKVLFSSDRFVQAHDLIEEIFPQIEDPNQISQVYSILFDIFYKEKNYEEALDICKKQKSLLPKISDENKRSAIDLLNQKRTVATILTIYDKMVLDGKIKEAEKFLEENEGVFTPLLAFANVDEECRELYGVYSNKKLEKLLNAHSFGELNLSTEKAHFQVAYEVSQGELRSIVALSLGVIEYNLKNYDLSKKYLTEALNSTKTINLLGWVHCFLGGVCLWEESLYGNKFEIAKDHFEKTIAFLPNPLIYREIARIYNYWGYTKEATRLVTIAEKGWKAVDIVRYPYAQLEVLKGSISNLLKLGEYEEALNKIEQSLQLKILPYDRLQLLDWKLDSLLELERLDEVEQLIGSLERRLTSESPELFIASLGFRLQQFYIKKGYPEKASESFKKYYSKLSFHALKVKFMDCSIPLYENTNILNKIFLHSYDTIISEKTARSFDIFKIGGIWIKHWGDVIQREKFDTSITEQDSRLLFLYGLFHSEGDNPEQAVLFLEKACSLGESHWFLTIGLANAYSKTGKLDMAEKKYRQLLKLGIPNYFIETNLVFILAAMGQLDEAEKILRDLQGEEGKDLLNICVINRCLGRFLFRYRSNYKEAKHLLKEAIDINPKDPESWFWLSTCLYFLNETNEAFNAINKALEIKPNFPEFLHNLGHILEKMGKSIDAVKTFKMTMKLEPDQARHAFCYNKLLKRIPLDIDTDEIMEKIPKDFKVRSIQYELICLSPDFKNSSVDTPSTSV